MKLNEENRIRKPFWLPFPFCSSRHQIARWQIWKECENALKNIMFWNLDLSSNTQSKGDLWFKCELFIVFVHFQKLNLCWNKANSWLPLNNNGVHSSVWITYSSSRGAYILCWRPWAPVLGGHGYCSLRLLLYPDVPSWMYAWSLGCIYTIWNGGNSDLQLKMWLTKLNGEHSIISVLWVVSERVWLKKWTTAQEEKVRSHEAVGTESANYGMSSLCQPDHMLQLPHWYVYT